MRNLTVIYLLLIGGMIGGVIGIQKSFAQESFVKKLDLETCYALAKSNYPLIKQQALISKSSELSLEKTAKAILPQLVLSGQASIQSEVTQLPFSMPNLDIPILSNDQYRLYAEVNQSLTDIFTIAEQKKFIEISADLEGHKVEVELYQLHQRINQLYFGVILLNAQKIQLALLSNEILTGIAVNRVAVDQGVALKSSVDLLEAERLKIQQRIIELESVKKSYLSMLSLFIKQEITDETTFETPTWIIIQTSIINRPELDLFVLEKKSFDSQSKLIDARNWPRFSLFAQGGYGRPGLNMLDNKFDPYYMGGLRLNWNFSGFYTQKQEKQLLKMQQSGVDVQKEKFLLQTELELKKIEHEILKLQALIQADHEIILLRNNVKLSAQNQLQYGTITTNDYISYLHAEDQARQDLILHQIQLLMAQHTYKTTAGN